MRRFLFSLLLIIIVFLVAHSGFAQEVSEVVDKAAGDKTGGGSLATDIQQAKELMMGKGGDNSFARGMLVALFQPIFLASMFSLGLWSGQMSTRLTHIWVLPVFVYAATVIGAFITAYHSEWKPQLENVKYLSELQSTDAVAIVVGLMIGGAVTMQMIVAPFFAVIGAVAVGLALGFSQTAEIGEHKNALMPFWMGFGLSGLLINIFGIGFETFLESIKMQLVTRWVGLATLVVSFFFGSKLF